MKQHTNSYAKLIIKNDAKIQNWCKIQKLGISAAGFGFDLHAFFTVVP